MRTGRTRSGRTTRAKSRADVGTETLTRDSWCVIERWNEGQSGEKNDMDREGKA